MKKAISLVLAVLTSFSLAACSGEEKITEEARKTFDDISLGYEISERIASDIYTAWREAIFNKDEVLIFGIENLDSKLELNDLELAEGLACTYASYIYKQDWQALSEEEKQAYRDIKHSLFPQLENELFGLCVLAVVKAYELNGEMERADDALARAEERMKDMGKRHANEGLYLKLQDFYSNTSALLEYCKDPEGSYSQWSETLKEYRDLARKQMAELDYLVLR